MPNENCQHLGRLWIMWESWPRSSKFNRYQWGEGEYRFAWQDRIPQLTAKAIRAPPSLSGKPWPLCIDLRLQRHPTPAAPYGRQTLSFLKKINNDASGTSGSPGERRTRTHSVEYVTGVGFANFSQLLHRKRKRTHSLYPVLPRMFSEFKPLP